MQGDSQALAHLNKVLGNELIAISQYFLHARMFQDWGMKRLADVVYEESLATMRHADALTRRILFLQGVPDLQNLGKLNIGEDAEEILNCDLSLEMKSLPDLRAAIDHCESVQDYVSRDLLRADLAAQESHIDWLETELQLLDKLGIEHYLQSRQG